MTQIVSRMKKCFIYMAVLVLPSLAFGEPQDLPTHIKEGSSAFISASFKDQNGVAVKPDSISYFITDEATGAITIPAVGPTPLASTQTFELNTCNCRIVNNARNTENRLGTFKYTYGGASQYTGTDYARYVCDNVPDIVVAQATPGTPCAVSQVPSPTPTRTPTATPTS